MYREFKRVLKALKEFEPKVARRRVSHPRSRTNRSRTNGPKFATYTSITDVRSYCPLFHKLFLFHKVIVYSRELQQTLG